MIILGIDPGSRVTGFGLIQVEGQRLTYLDSGAIRTAAGEFPQRLHTIFEGIRELISQYSPDESAIEKVFMHRNPDSALKLGQARGAAICALTSLDLHVSEYTPAEVKKATVGNGNAAKEQVQHMITALLSLPTTPQEDAADALAIAICHANGRQMRQLLPSVSGHRRGRYR